MKEENFKIISEFDGLPLDTLLFIPDEIKGVVLISHGMSEHKERYIDFCKFLANNNFVSCINDHRGHGKSVKDVLDLGYFYDATGKAIVLDTYQIIRYLKDRFPNVPVTLFGHSMGSFVVRSFCKKYDEHIDKLVVCGSPSDNGISGLGIRMVKAITKMKGDHYISDLLVSLSTGAYERKFAKEGMNAWLSVNKENVKKYNEDPYCGFPFTTNGYCSLMNLMHDTYSKHGWQKDNKKLEVLFISGSEDPCAESKEKWQQAMDSFRSHGYTNVKGKMYQGYRHEILQEDCKEEVYKDVLDFID